MQFFSQGDILIRKLQILIYLLNSASLAVFHKAIIFFVSHCETFFSAYLYFIFVWLPATQRFYLFICSNFCLEIKKTKHVIKSLVYKGNDQDFIFLQHFFPLQT